MLVVVPLLLIVGFVLTVLLLLQPPSSSACDTAGEPVGPATGNLGGVSGTGITASELRAVRSSSLAGNTFTEGVFHSTAYGPPWGIDPVSGVDQGAGISTAGGLRLNGGAPRKYFVATDPAVISLGQWLYIWPNPFQWRGPFLAADTGGAINGRDIDFYDWRGRSTQLAWSKPVEVVRAPMSPLGPGPADMPPGGGGPAPTVTAPPTAGCGGTVAPGALGELTGTPEQIVNRIVAYAHGHGFPNVTPDSVRVANASHGPTDSGNRSDHQGPPDVAWAADISNGGSPTKEMDDLAQTITSAFGIPWPGSGVVEKTADGYRIQVLYRTKVGGNHFNHVHVGVKRTT